VKRLIGSDTKYGKLVEMKNLNKFISILGLIKVRLKIRTRIRYFFKLSAEIGFLSTARCFLNEVLYSKKHLEFILKGKSVTFPLWLRAGTSDLEVFYDILCDKAYSYIERMNDVSFVIDCGANVGYFSALCLSMFPDCTVVAVEPDKENFRIMQRNLAPYSGRVNAINAGIWSHRTALAISTKPYRDGREWTKQVRECLSGEACDLAGIDVSTIMKEVGRNHVSLLKIDIEGSEAVVFSKNYENWINHVDVIMIELHDDSDFGKGSDAFYNAINDGQFSITHQGELTIARSLH
jgi:FkbM family methyltransferase